MSNKKMLFWDRFFWIMVALFVIPMVLYISSSEWLANNDIFLYITGGAILVSIVMSLIFRFGMVYNAYKIKRYGWMVCSLILGNIFVIIFYFGVLKKKLNDKSGNKNV